MPRPGTQAGKPSFGAILKKNARLLVLLVLAGASYGGYSLYAWRKPYEWSGSVEAKTISVGSRTGGRVKDVLVREGENVRAGQPLVLLEAGDLEAQRAIAEAEVELAEASLQKLSNGARAEEIAQARARHLAASAALAQAGGVAAREFAELKRARTLFAAGAISKAEVERAEGAYKAAVAGTSQEAARAREMAAATSQLESGTRVEDISAAAAQVKVAKGKLAQIQASISELTVKAPRDARVETLTIRPGDILGANATAVSLLERDQLFVRVYIPETLIGRVKTGDRVPISVDSFPNRTFTGVVEHVNTVGEYTPRNLTTIEERADEVFGARVALIEGQDELRAGMVAFIHVKKR